MKNGRVRSLLGEHTTIVLACCRRIESLISLARHILTHTSGLSMPAFCPKLAQLEQFTGPRATLPKTIVDEYTYPLAFQPGTAWTYGTGYDWAGQLVERLSGLPLEAYMRAHIWDPLHMQAISFWPAAHPAMQARRVGTSLKDERGALVPSKEGPAYMYDEHARTDAYGGGGAWASADAFLPLLQSLCANDGRVLAPATADELFRPQLNPAAQHSFNEQLRTVDLARRVYANSFDVDRQVMDYGLGGEIGTKDEEEGGRRRAGTMSWGGLPNLIWWVDRAAGLCGALFTGLVPVGDVRVSGLEAVFERAVYERYEELKRQGL